MTDSALRARAWRQYLSTAGACHRCRKPAEGYYCLRCKRETAQRAREQMQRSRLTRAFLVVWYAILPANLCVSCKQPKERFHDWHCRACKRKVFANLHSHVA
jgi:hypothetical protein